MIRKIALLSISLFIFLSCTESEINYTNQSDNLERYNSQIFETITVTKDIRYGDNISLNGTAIGLSMDVYQPKNDTEINRPLIVLAHGGSFISGNKSDLTEIATFLAKAGYVVASINYRLLDITPSQLAFKQVVINAVVDMKAAVRYFNKDVATTNIYKINTNKIFIGGYSAGAITALHYAYVNNTAELTTIGGSPFVDYVNSKGGLDGGSGNPTYSSKVEGVINISGALFDKNFINASEPTIYSIHGTDDAVVPYLNGNINGTGILTDGSGLIHPYATSIGITSILKTIEKGKHDAFLKCTSCFVEIRTFLFSQL
jgi:predicted esterase